MPRGEHTSSKRNLTYQNILRSLNAKRKKNKINDKDHQILLRQAQDILNGFDDQQIHQKGLTKKILISIHYGGVGEKRPRESEEEEERRKRHEGKEIHEIEVPIEASQPYHKLYEPKKQEKFPQIRYFNYLQRKVLKKSARKQPYLLPKSMPEYNSSRYFTNFVTGRKLPLREDKTSHHHGSLLDTSLQRKPKESEHYKELQEQKRINE